MPSSPLLYSKAVRRCETCDGCGRELDCVDQGMSANDIFDVGPCSDCIEGWVSEDVDEACGGCGGDKSHPQWEANPDCPRCDGSGRTPAPWSIVCRKDPIRTYRIRESGIVLSVGDDDCGPVVFVDIPSEDCPQSFYDIGNITLDLSALEADQTHRLAANRWTP